jgi:tetratricopeptide (TPR) repeat protein
VLALREGKSGEAVALLSEVDVNSLEPEQRYLFNYNYGRALELSGNASEAYKRYSQVLEEQPEHEAAREGAFRVLSRPPRIAEAASLAERLLAKGEREPVVREVRGLLVSFSADPEAQRLLAVLLRYYAGSRFEPAKFQAAEGKTLAMLSERGSRLESAASQVVAAVKGELPIFVERGRAFAYFSGWTGEEWKTQPFSQFLKACGDAFDRAEKPRDALARYSAAWALDPGNTDAALYAALILSDHSFEPAASRQLLDRLTEGIFQDKMAAYRRLDWVNILRLHSVLGTLYEKQGKWGPASDPRSAVFQWTNALRAESEVRREKPNFPPSPGVYLHLATCYQRLGEPETAWGAYIKAGYAFLGISKTEDAAAALERSRALRIAMTPEKQDAARKLESAIAQSRKVPG